MAKAKCGYCGLRAGKRYCPALDKIICPVCCASNRLKNISCPDDCKYLEHEQYQQKLLKEKELNQALESLHHSEMNDIFHDQNAAMIAYGFESFYGECYVHDLFNLTDQKVKESLSSLYFHLFHNRPLEKSDFTQALLEQFTVLEEEGYNKELIGKVILRLLISIKNISGGKMGAYGYLNYVKNNILTAGQSLSDSFIVETKDGEKSEVKLKDIDKSFG